MKIKLQFFLVSSFIRQWSIISFESIQAPVISYDLRSHIDHLSLMTIKWYEIGSTSQRLRRNFAAYSQNRSKHVVDTAQNGADTSRTRCRPARKLIIETFLRHVPLFQHLLNSLYDSICFSSILGLEPTVRWGQNLDNLKLLSNSILFQKTNRTYSHSHIHCQCQINIMFCLRTILFFFYLIRI